MGQYEDFFVKLAQNQMKSKLLEYCSVNRHDTKPEINVKESWYTYACFHSPLLFAFKLDVEGGKCCCSLFLRGNRLYYLRKVFPPFSLPCVPMPLRQGLAHCSKFRYRSSLLLKNCNLRRISMHSEGDAVTQGLTKFPLTAVTL